MWKKISSKYRKVPTERVNCDVKFTHHFHRTGDVWKWWKTPIVTFLFFSTGIFFFMSMDKVGSRRQRFREIEHFRIDASKNRMWTEMVTYPVAHVLVVRRGGAGVLLLGSFSNEYFSYPFQVCKEFYSKAKIRLSHLAFHLFLKVRFEFIRNLTDVR